LLPYVPTGAQVNTQCRLYAALAPPTEDENSGQSQCQGTWENDFSQLPDLRHLVSDLYFQERPLTKLITCMQEKTRAIFVK